MNSARIAQAYNQLSFSLVIGNPSQFGLSLSQELLDRNLKVVHVSSTPIHSPAFSQLSKNPLYSHTSQFQPEDIPQSITYIFYLLSSSSKPSLLKSIISYSQSHQAKLSVVVINHPLETKSKHKHSRFIENTLTTSLKLHPFNVRLIYLHDLFGPNLQLKSTNPLGYIFSALRHHQIIVAGNENQVVYPLFVKDALEGIFKATFSSNSIGKIFQLAGSEISLLNLCYKIRSLIPQPNFSTIVDQKFNWNYPPETNNQIQSTWTDLGWLPKANLNHALSSTIHWLLESTPFTSSSEFIQPDPTKPSLQSLPPIQHSPQLPNSFIDQNHEDQILLSQHQHLSQQFRTETSTDSTTSSTPKKFSLTKLPSTHQISPHKPTTPSPSSSSFLKPKLSVVASFKSHRIQKLFISIFLLFTISISIITRQIYLTHVNYRQFLSAVQSQNIDQLLLTTPRLNQQIDTILIFYSQIKPLLAFVINDSTIQNYQDTITITSTLIKAASSGASAYTDLSTVIQIVLGNLKGDINQLTSQAQTNLLDSYHYLAQTEAVLKSNSQLSINHTSPVISKLVSLANHALNYRSKIGSLQLLIQNPDWLLGQDKKRTFLILLQNDAELRPTGGFIGSYALVTIEKGQLLDIHVEDVYTADGQLRGHVEPPAPIKQHLGEAGWFLRDSNWDPHFPGTARTIEWFFQKETGQVIDGVVGINMKVIQKILEVTGPIQVLDYNVTITSDNLFERSEYLVETDYFPGSTQKRDFLGKLTSTLIDRILKSDTSQWVKLFQALINSADENQLQIALNHPQSMIALDQLGWSGNLENPQCQPTLPQTPCVNDYVAIVEANLSVNKSNYFVEREINHHTQISTTGSITSTINLQLHNTSPGEMWPGGRYKNYLRIYTPLNSKLVTISLNDQQLPLKNIDVSIDHNKTVFGFLVQTKPGETNTVTLSYQPPAVSTNSNFVYQLFYQKQSGTAADPFTFTLSYPPTFHTSTTQPHTISTNQLNYSHPLTTDQLINVELTR